MFSSKIDDYFDVELLLDKNIINAIQPMDDRILGQSLYYLLPLVALMTGGFFV